jgi:hypothetical protein
MMRCEARFARPRAAYRSQPPGFDRRAFPRMAQVRGEVAGQAQLGVHGDGWVGPGRPAEIAPGRLPRPARRVKWAAGEAPMVRVLT